MILSVSSRMRCSWSNRIRSSREGMGTSPGGLETIALSVLNRIDGIQRRDLFPGLPACRTWRALSTNSDRLERTEVPIGDEKGCTHQCGIVSEIGKSNRGWRSQARESQRGGLAVDLVDEGGGGIAVGT